MDPLAAVVPEEQVIMEGPDDRIGRCEDRLPLIPAGIFDVPHLAEDRLAILHDKLQGDLSMDTHGYFNGLDLFAIDWRVRSIFIGFLIP